MKKTSKGFILLAAALLLAGYAGADLKQGEGIWEGKGVRYGTDGKALGSFQARVVNKAQGAKVLRSEIKVVLDNGEVILRSQTLTQEGQGFTLKSEDGEGRGVLTGNGIFQAVLDNAKGGQFVITSIEDGEDMRVAVTQMENQKPVAYICEKLKRVK